MFVCTLLLLNYLNQSKLVLSLSTSCNKIDCMIFLTRVPVNVSKLNLKYKIAIYFQHDLDGMGNYMRTLANTGASTMFSMFDSWDPLADTTKLLTNVLKVNVFLHIFSLFYGAIQVLRNAFFQGISPHPPSCNANNVVPYTFVMLFSGKVDTPTPHGVT